MTILITDNLKTIDLRVMLTADLVIEKNATHFSIVKNRHGANSDIKLENSILNQVLDNPNGHVETIHKWVSAEDEIANKFERFFIKE